MKTRNFVNAGRAVSEIGLGCWQLGADWGHVSDKDALSILETAVDSGVTFFDTADVYGAGRSETLIGKFLRGWQEDVFVATKIGRKNYPGPSSPSHRIPLKFWPTPQYQNCRGFRKKHTASLPQSTRARSKSISADWFDGV